MSVIVQEWVSLDGFAAGRDGEGVLFEGLDPDADSRSEAWNERLLEGIDSVLLGRRTYEQFAQFWPDADARMAAPVNAVPKRVASASLRDAPWGDHAPLAIERHPLDWLRRTDERVLVWGSLALTAELHRAGLVDELDLFVAPVLLGRGVRLLPADAPVRLEQLLSEDWGAVTHVRYRVRV